MIEEHGKSGIINGVYSNEEIEKFENFFYKLKNPYVCVSNNMFYSMDDNHPLRTWFHKNVFQKIQSLFGDDLKLMFGSLLYSKEPFTVHSDYYHRDHREPYMAFIIPLCSYSHTIIFNEEDVFADGSKKPNNDIENFIMSFPVKEDNALQYKNQYLSHHSDEILSRLTVKNILKWEAGSLIYWDEKLLHCSDNYINNDYDYKKGLVIHTYKDKI